MNFFQYSRYVKEVLEGGHRCDHIKALVSKRQATNIATNQSTIRMKIVCTDTFRIKPTSQLIRVILPSTFGVIRDVDPVDTATFAPQDFVLRSQSAVGKIKHNGRLGFFALQGCYIGSTKTCDPLFMARTPTIYQLAAKMKVIFDGI